MKLSLQLNLTAPKGTWGGLFQVQNCVLHAWEGVTDPNADAVIFGNKSDFVADLANGEYSPERLKRIAAISGDAGVVNRFLEMLEPFSPNFNIILPEIPLWEFFILFGIAHKFVYIHLSDHH